MSKAGQPRAPKGHPENRRLSSIDAAVQYEAPSSSFAVVTAIFNPAGYRSRVRNYGLFAEPLLAAGIALHVVECAFDERSFEVANQEGVTLHRVRARHRMWQKERLLNVAIERLPDHVGSIAWIDADVLFENPAWAVEAEARLRHAPIVQLFDYAYFLPKGSRHWDGVGECWRGFASSYSDQGASVVSGPYGRHGTTGLAWAARREVLEGGLYDRCIWGSGDHVMAHVFANDWPSVCLSRVTGHAALSRDVSRWAQRIGAHVNGTLAQVDGAALHMWHGDLADRGYSTRFDAAALDGFDPETDLKINEDGAWVFSGAAHTLDAWAAEYFRHRFEDGRSLPRVRARSDATATPPAGLPSPHPRAAHREMPSRTD